MKRLLFLLLLVSQVVFAQQDILLSTYKYPFEVSYLALNSQHQQLKMAYMDVKPQNPNGKVVVLLHGKNFNGAYWRTTIQSLTKNGYRVIAPDQIGFGKSSKPTSYQFTFQQLAQNTKGLLDQLGIRKIYLLGHSMGGMIATRFTLMYPDIVGKLILEDPLGLEDWKRVAPYAPIDSNYQKEMKTDFAAAKKYQQENYYHGTWKPEYDAAVKAQMGQYPKLAQLAQQQIKGSQLIQIDGTGHLPHIEAFDRFIGPLEKFLAN